MKTPAAATKAIADLDNSLNWVRTIEGELRAANVAKYRMNEISRGLQVIREGMTMAVNLLKKGAQVDDRLLDEASDIKIALREQSLSATIRVLTKPEDVQPEPIVGEYAIDIESMGTIAGTREQVIALIQRLGGK